METGEPGRGMTFSSFMVTVLAKLMAWSSCSAESAVLPSGEMATRTGPLCAPPTGISPMNFCEAASMTVMVWPSEFAT